MGECDGAAIKMPDEQVLSWLQILWKKIKEKAMCKKSCKGGGRGKKGGKR